MVKGKLGFMVQGEGFWIQNINYHVIYPYNLLDPR